MYRYCAHRITLHFIREHAKWDVDTATSEKFPYFSWNESKSKREVNTEKMCVCGWIERNTFSAMLKAPMSIWDDATQYTYVQRCSHPLRRLPNEMWAKQAPAQHTTVQQHKTIYGSTLFYTYYIILLMLFSFCVIKLIAWLHISTKNSGMIISGA